MLVKVATEVCLQSCNMHQNEMCSTTFKNKSSKYAIKTTYNLILYTLLMVVKTAIQIQVTEFHITNKNDINIQVYVVNMLLLGRINHLNFKWNFINEKWFILIIFFIEVCSLGVIDSMVPTGSDESKLRTFQEPFQDQISHYKDFYGEFHNADIPNTPYMW